MRKGLRTAFTVLRIAVGVGLLAYLGFSGVIDWSALGGLATAWPLTVMAFALLLLCMVVTAWRLCVLMRPHGLELSLFASVKLTLIGVFFSLCLPGATGGDAVRFYYAASGNRGRRMEVATILVVDRAAGMFGLLAWPLLAAPLFPALVTSSPVFPALLLSAAAAVVAMVGLVIVAASPAVRRHPLLVGALGRIRFGTYLERALDTVHGYRHDMRTLAAAAGISLLAHTFAIMVVLTVSRALNPGAFSWETSLLVPLGFMANTLPLTPGGLGVGEAVFERLFSLAGLAGGAEIMLGWRVILLLVGLLGLLAYLRGTERFVHAQPAADGTPRPVVPTPVRPGAMSPAVPAAASHNYRSEGMS
jgi:uncharacterized protein (TIRG00374 family)